MKIKFVQSMIDIIRGKHMPVRTEVSWLRAEVSALRGEISRMNSLTRNDLEYENKRRMEDPLHLDRYGYKVYSQHDEDGIIQEIFKRIGTTNKTWLFP